MQTIGRVLAIVAVAIFAVVAYAYLTLPDVRALATTNPGTTAFMELRAREANAAGRPLRHEHRWVPYSRISPNLKRAVLVAEDTGFWQHEGVDLEQVKESFEINWEEGKALRGASTITQQLAKNLYLSPSRNPIRKLRELIIARRLEAALPKARIFEMYLNVIEWGDGVWGAEAAARRYFGVPASALTAEQSARLAGAIINPRLLNPARPSPRLARRERIILRRMGRVTPPVPAPVIASTPMIPPPAESGSHPEVEPAPVPQSALPPATNASRPPI